jgi:hypothetical protein
LREIRPRCSEAAAPRQAAKLVWIAGIPARPHQPLALIICPRGRLERLPIFNVYCPNFVLNRRLKLIRLFEGWLGLVASDPHPHRKRWSVPCGTIFPRPCAGSGVLASVARAHIGLTCTTCADPGRSGTPNTAAWPPKRVRSASQMRGQAAPTRIAPEGSSRSRNGIGLKPIARLATLHACHERPPVAMRRTNAPTRLSSLNRYETATELAC